MSGIKGLDTSVGRELLSEPTCSQSKFAPTASSKVIVCRFSGDFSEGGSSMDSLLLRCREYLHQFHRVVTAKRFWFCSNCMAMGTVLSKVFMNPFTTPV